MFLNRVILGGQNSSQANIRTYLTTVKKFLILKMKAICFFTKGGSGSPGTLGVRGMLSSVYKCGSPPRFEFVENLVSGRGNCSTASIAIEYSDPKDATELGFGEMAGVFTTTF